MDWRIISNNPKKITIKVQKRNQLANWFFRFRKIFKNLRIVGQAGILRTNRTKKPLIHLIIDDVLLK